MGVKVRQKVKDGPWWVFVAHRGKRKSKLVGEHKAANQLAKELRQALAAGDFGLLQEPAPAAGPTFTEYAEQFLNKTEPRVDDPTHGLKRSTWNDYSLCIHKRLAPILGARPMVDIRRRDVKDLAVALQQQGLSPVNARKHLRVLSSILSEAVDDELIPANPAAALHKQRRSKQKVIRKAISPLSEQELAALLETAQTYSKQRGAKAVYPFREHYPFLLLLAHTGMRLGEAIALQWGDVDWRGRFIEVRRSSVQGELSVPKNGKARRVDLSDALYGVLRERFALRFEKVRALDPEADAELEAERAAGLDAWIFPDTTGGIMNVGNLRRRVFHPLLVTAKLRKVRIHDLRHTYASLLFQKGAALHYVQQQLGHHSPAFTLTVYMHLMPGDHQRFVNLLGAPAPACTPAAPATDNADAAETPEKKKAVA
ncbi:MAG TPA: tyrosine-type recombinase/integrase [Candidatus Binatia bacterium]